MEQTTYVLSICVLMAMYFKTESAVTNIALNKKVSASSYFPHPGWGPGNAVNGVIKQTECDTCGCCAATSSDKEINAWFRVDLGSVYMIHGLAVYGRVHGSETFQTTDIFLHNHTSILGSPATTISEATITYNHTFTSLVAARYVTVRYRGQRMLVLCEIEVFGECPDGTFGASCTSKCHCEGSPCNKTSGVCPSGRCIPGYTGDRCNQTCTAGYYGRDCSKRCGHCRDNTCHYINGTCTPCEDGYTGDRCNQECPAGKFGRDCVERCGHCRNNAICNNVSGACRLCSDGFVGSLCKTECLFGTYGYNCSETCGHCYNNGPCDLVVGTCTRCMAGYTGSLCKEYCRSGSYGQDCANQCGACADDTCHPVSGVCTACSPGYRNEFCSATCVAGTYGASCNSTCVQCLGNTTCHHINGQCVSQCENDFTGNHCSSNESTGVSPKSAVLYGVVGSVLFVIVTAIVIGIFFIRKRGICIKLRRKEDASNFAGMQGTISEDITYVNTHERNPYEQLKLSVNTTIVSTDNVYASICSDEMPGSQAAPMTTVYYNVCTRDINMADLWNAIRDKKANNCKLFQTEFKILKNQLNAKQGEQKDGNQSCMDGILDGNLQSTPGNRRLDLKSIYGFGKEMKFLAVIGPSRATANDFWELIWEQKTEIIVMLSKRKHVQYWPIGGDKHAECFGNVDVKLVKTRTFTDFDIRQFEVTKSPDYRNDDSQVISVTQYHYRTWPINDNPDTVWSFVNFWRAVDSSNTKSPIVVHSCEKMMPAGMFITLNILHNQATCEGHVSLFETIVKIGGHLSSHILQTWEQYMFLHEALAESLLLGTHCVLTKQMKDISEFMSQTINGSKATNFDLQFRRIGESTNGPESVEGLKRRTTPPFPVPSYFQSLHASYLPTYPDGYGIIIARTPTEYNLHNFWTLVEEQKSKTIIMMTDKSHPNDNFGRVLGAEEENDFGKFAVTFSEERTFGSFIQRIFKLDENIENKTSRRIITQYTFTGWNDDSIAPRDTQPIVDMISHVLNWQILIQQDQPVVVCCRDGYTKSGLVSVILNESNRIRSTGDKVNLVESVKSLKDVNKNIIPSSEQLKFCYKAILCYLGID